jgi:uncharacterized Zn-binding protein involved in type VI secretion
MAYDIVVIGLGPTPMLWPITSGSPNVTISGLPAVRKGDHHIYGFEVKGEGDPNVLIDGRPAMRIGSDSIPAPSTIFTPASATLKLPAMEISGATPESNAVSLTNAEGSAARTLYWLELKLIAGDALTFKVENFGSYHGFGEAATFNITTHTLHIPYLYLGGETTYWLDMQLSAGGEVVLELIEFGENPSPAD